MFGTTQTRRSALAVLAGALILAQASFAAGEPKNQAPFTQSAAHGSAQPSRIGLGEPKNEWPFTRSVTR